MLTSRGPDGTEYEAWLREIVPIAGQAEGHRGVNVIRPHPGSRTYTVVLHFDRLEHLEQWLASDIRKRLVAKVQHLLEDLASSWVGGSRAPGRAWSISAGTSMVTTALAGWPR